MLAPFPGHDHQHAQRGDFGLAHGIPAVEVVAALFEKGEDGLRLVPQGDGLRVVTGEPGEPLQRVGQAGPRGAGWLRLRPLPNAGELQGDGKQAAVTDDFAGARFKPVLQAFAVAAEFGAATIKNVGGDGAKILPGSGKGCGFGALRPRREVVFPHVAGVDCIRRVGERKPALAAVNKLGDSGRAYEDGKHLLEFAAGAAVDTTEESEKQRGLGHVTGDGADALIHRASRTAQREVAHTVEGAANQRVSAPKEADLALLGVLGDFQPGREANGAGVGVDAGRAFDPRHPSGGERQFGDVRRGFADVAAFKKNCIANETGEINAIQNLATLAGLVGFGEQRGFGIEPVCTQLGVGRGGALEALQAAVNFFQQLPRGGIRAGVFLAGHEIEDRLFALEQGGLLLDQAGEQPLGGCLG